MREMIILQKRSLKKQVEMIEVLCDMKIEIKKSSVKFLNA